MPSPIDESWEWWLLPAWSQSPVSLDLLENLIRLLKELLIKNGLSGTFQGYLYEKILILREVFLVLGIIGILRVVLGVKAFKAKVDFNRLIQ